jgi:seryl-tRNA synthetase
MTTEEKPQVAPDAEKPPVVVEKAPEPKKDDKELNKLKADLEAAKKQAEESEKKLAEIEKSKLDEHQKELLEAKEAVKKDFEPTVERLKKLEESFEKLLEQELADIPEDKKDLVPDYPSAEDKLAWLKKAKAGGVFGSPKASSSSVIPAGQVPKAEEKPDADSLNKLAAEDPKKFWKTLTVNWEHKSVPKNYRKVN